MTLWADSFVCPREGEDVFAFLRALRRMGYGSVGMCEESYARVKSPEELRRATGVEVLRAKLIEAAAPGEAKRRLRACGELDIVIGRPKSLETYRFMSRDTRFNIVEVPPKMIKHIDRGEAGLLTNSGGYLGFNMRLLVNEPGNFPLLRAFLMKVVKWAIPFRFYSSATVIYEAWHPKHIYFLGKFIGLPGRRVLEGLSDAPLIKGMKAGDSRVL